MIAPVASRTPLVPTNVNVTDAAAGLVFRSVGYRGVALRDVPFDPRTGLIPNLKGRVLDAPGGAPLAGHYATGWIKRGPTGVIGNNKADSVETVRSLMADAPNLPRVADGDPDAVEAVLRARGVR